MIFAGYFSPLDPGTVAKVNKGFSDENGGFQLKRPPRP